MLNSLGEACIDFGEHDEAERSLNAMRDDREAARRADPDDLDAARSLALSHQQLGNLAARREDFDRAISEYSLALPIFEDLARRAPTSVAAHKDRVIILRRFTDLEIDRGRSDEAAAPIERILEIQTPKDVPPHADEAGWVEETRLVRAVVGLMPAAMADPGRIPKSTPAVEQNLRRHRAINPARRCRIAEADEAARSLLAIPGDGFDSLVAARTYAAILESLDPGDPEARSRHLRACLDA